MIIDDYTISDPTKIESDFEWDEQTTNSGSLSRRELPGTFFEGLASLGIVIPTIFSGIASAEEPKKKNPTLAPFKDLKDLGNAITTFLKLKHGHILNNQEIEQLVTRALQRLKSSQGLYKTELENGEDPSVAFRADLP